MALGWLARRPLAEAELRKRLGDRGFSDDEVERTVGELIAEKLIDDAGLAADYVVLRAQRMHLGRGRLVRDLQRRGVDRAVAENAWRQAVDSGDLDAGEILRSAVARRLGREREFTAAVRRRVYNALFRAGFAAADVYAELGRQWPPSDAESGYDDDEGA